MIDFKLSLSKFQQECLQKELEKAYKQGNIRIITRIKVILSIAQGCLFSEIAKILGISEESIRQWIIKFFVSGIKALVSDKKKSGRPTKLTKTQLQQLYQWIEAGPHTIGFPGACWRTPMIQDLILKKFGVFYNARYLSQLLKNLGLSYQKARFAVGGKDPENKQKRETWFKDVFPQALKEANTKKAYLLFGDEASFPQWGSLTYTWSPIGKQPTIQTSGIRKGYKVFGMIDYFSGTFFYKAITERLNSESYQQFLQEILNKTSKPIVLIQDGARYHTSAAMQQFFEKNKSRLSIYQLPSYSPDFNPIEKLWKNIKKDEIHLHYFPTFESLTKKVEEALLHFSNRSKDILGLFDFLLKPIEA